MCAERLTLLQAVDLAIEAILQQAAIRSTPALLQRANLGMMLPDPNFPARRLLAGRIERQDLPVSEHQAARDYLPKAASSRTCATTLSKS
jgi:hypothetical protein